MQTMGQRWSSVLSSVAVLALVLGTVSAVAVTTATDATAAQPVPGHSSLVPQVPRKNTPRISTGEIWDMEVVGNRVFVAGGFTSLTNTTGTTNTVNQRYLAAYNIDTGRVDETFRPTFNGGVSAVEASPDGTKLFVGGTFNTVNGVARQKVASLSLTTGAPISGFAVTASTNNQVTALAATNTTVYVGGKFTRINGQLRTGLAALNASTGAVDTGFTNDISGGIGVNGALTVQQLKLTHDETKLLVVHTGRQIAGQDRLGVGLINTQTKALLPWRTRLWDENLAIVGGVQRIYAGDIAPDDSYFVVGSGSGGDRPPISDTAIAYPIAGGDFVQPLWISRMFDSVYSIAITERAVYLGGHFSWNESPTADQPWPGLDNVGYGTGQGLSGYGLGDQVVRRDHIGALNPADGTALEWNPGSNSFEGNKAMEATSRGLFVGGDGMFQGGVRTGRVAFYDFSSVPAPATTDTTIVTPIEGRVVTSGVPLTIEGTAKNPQGIRRVQVEIQDRDSKQYLQDDGVSWGRSNNFYATLGAGTTNRTWSLPVTLTGIRNLQIMAKTFGLNGTNDATKAIKKIEVFSFDDTTPTTSINGPSGIQTSTTFTMTGTASDDHGVNALTYWFRDESNQYLQNDGTVAPIYNTFRGTPDVIGAPSATWSYEVTLPHEGVWRGSATAIDDAGQADLRSATRDFTVNSNAVAPAVTITLPTAMTPPFAVPTLVVAPGAPITFAGTATDDKSLRNVEISLRNNTTREALGSDGTWGAGVAAGVYRVSPVNIGQPSYNWSYLTPFNLTPGSYSFTVRATDNDDLSTPTSSRGSLTITAQVPGDSPPDGLLGVTGTVTATGAAITLAGTATDDKGVAGMKVTVFDNDTGRYMQDNGSMVSGFNTLDNATLAAPNATSTAWSLPIVLPTSGDYSVTAYAVDTVGQWDTSTTGATVRYKYYPGDALPTFETALGQPIDNTAFSQGKIVVTGRALDDQAVARVEVGIVDSLNRYLASNGTFTSTTPSYRNAFLNSPGSTGSNFSYTTPVIPDGTYSVRVRAMDQNDQYSLERVSVGITVTHPANNPPVASFTVSCAQNVCSFDGRGSTDENPAALSYSWSFGDGGTGTGSVPVRTYTTPGAKTVTLTVRDEWGQTAIATQSVTIAEPAGNTAPVPTFTVNCIALACTTSSTGTVDPNTGDVITYVWNWGDLTATTTGATGTHTYAAQGSYAVTLTVTDGWGKTASISKTVTMTEPASNTAPAAAFSVTCVGMTCTTFNTTTDAQGDAIRYSWNFGDGSALVTTAAPQRVYTAAGTYTITLTATDGWNKSATVSHQVTVPAP